MTPTAPRLKLSLASLPLVTGAAALIGGAAALIGALTGGAALIAGAALIGSAVPTGVAIAQAATPAGNAQRGQHLYLAVGCYECHGTTGTGAITGPKIAPNPIPFPAFIYQLRHPLGAPSYGNIKMPAYGEAVLSDAQVADLYAYLASIGPSPPASKIPLLNR